MSEPLLHVRNLTIDLPSASGWLPVVRGVDLSLNKGQALGIVGESGSGKSMTALALMRLLPKGARVSADYLSYQDLDLQQLSENHFAKIIAGRKIGMIFQEPMTSLNPVYTIERQMTEALILDGTAPKLAREKALYLLNRVRLPNPHQRLASYPHQLSGGQRQRIMIAMALMSNPQLLIADEPTTALDVTVQAQILELLDELREEFGMAMILITHDLAVVANSVDKVMVMYAGEMLEGGSTRDVLQHPVHPYTRGLLGCDPGRSSRHARLQAIPGIVPSLSRPWSGCIFKDRCTHASPQCAEQTPPAPAPETDAWLRCWHPQADPLPVPAPQTMSATVAAPAQSLLRAKNIVRTFVQPQGLFKKPYSVQALRGCCLEVRSRQTLAIVGESGSGKSTLARILLGLDTPDSGQVEINGKAITTLSPLERASWIQPVFQDPYSSLNPRHTIGSIIARPAVLHHAVTARQAQEAVADMLNHVGLPLRVLNQYPNQLSGGQRQRVAIARALMLKPKILLCDEPTSALDVSVQAQILNLLQDLQQEFGLSMLFITHDIGVVRKVADDIVVMHQGRIIETGTAEHILAAPQQPYTQKLLTSAPTLQTLQQQGALA